MANLITQVLMKKLLFVTKKVFHEIIVWLCVDLHTYIESKATCPKPHRSSVKISEHGGQRLHTLYMQDKSSKMKISIYSHWKLAEPWQFRQLQNTAPQALIDGAKIWTAKWLYNIVLSENLASWILDPWSSKLETRSSHLETRNVWASRREDRVSSFELQVSTYFWAVLFMHIHWSHGYFAEHQITA